MTLGLVRSSSRERRGIGVECRPYQFLLYPGVRQDQWKVVHRVSILRIWLLHARLTREVRGVVESLKVITRQKSQNSSSVFLKEVATCYFLQVRDMFYGKGVYILQIAARKNHK